MFRLYETDKLALSRTPQDLYESLEFPGPYANRPYCYINMASTLDGKIVVGQPNGTAAGVGSSMDQLLFRRLQSHCDAAIIGATTLRASNVIYPPETIRMVITASGSVPLGNRFFTDAPERAYIVCPASASHHFAALPTKGPHLIVAGDEVVDFPYLMNIVRNELGVKLLLCEGGGTINEQLIRHDLVDELFLTLAPKLKGGANLHTIMDGSGFPPGEFASCKLLAVLGHESELYLRYKIVTR